MSIKLKKQASGSIANPPASHVAFFIDENGIPSIKDSDGVVSPSLSVDGSPLSLNAQEEAPDAETDKVKLYAKVVEGVTQPFFRTDDGTEIQVGEAPTATVQTFFDDSQSAELNQLLATGGTYSWDTGLSLADLPDNATFVIHLESRSIAAEQNGQDCGFIRWILAWNSAPTPDATITGAIQISGESPDNTTFLIENTLDDMTLTAGSTLGFEFASGKGVDLQLILKVTISPVTELSFTPIAPA